MATQFSPAAIPGDQLVTASDLVRHFGMWQERALRAPVYVLHRGRPRHVLTSMDLLEALLAARKPADAQAATPMLGELLDTVREPLIAVDGRGVVIVASRTAAVLLGQSALDGLPVAQAWPSPHDVVAHTVDRVIATGRGDSIETTVEGRAGRRLLMFVDPVVGGALLHIQDVTASEQVADLAADRQALDTALVAAGDIARARVNLRGYIEAPDHSLAALTGLGVEALGTSRLVSLVEIGSRVAIGDSLEVVMTKGTPQVATASLLVNRGPSRTIRLAMAPIRRGAAIEAVCALLIAEPGGCMTT